MIELELELAELDCCRLQLVAVVADLVVVPVVVLVVVLVVAVAAEVVVVLAVEPDVDLESAVEVRAADLDTRPMNVELCSASKFEMRSVAVVEPVAASAEPVDFAADSAGAVVLLHRAV